MNEYFWRLDSFISHCCNNIDNDEMDIYKDIVYTVRSALRSRPINDLIQEGWFSYSDSVKRDIKNMILNCFDDPDVKFIEKHYDKNGVEYESNLYIHENCFDRLMIRDCHGHILSKEIEFPVNALEIFWDEMMCDKSKTNAKHFITTAQSLNYDGNGYTKLYENIIRMLETNEIEYRFNDALYQKSRENIPCMGCRENQENQEAHMFEGGCLFGL
jgi:hypothetical protein